MNGVRSASEKKNSFGSFRDDRKELFNFFFFSGKNRFGNRFRNRDNYTTPRSTNRKMTKIEKIIPREGKNTNDFWLRLSLTGSGSFAIPVRSISRLASPPGGGQTKRGEGNRKKGRTQRRAGTRSKCHDQTFVSFNFAQAVGCFAPLAFQKRAFYRKIEVHCIARTSAPFCPLPAVGISAPILSFTAMAPTPLVMYLLLTFGIFTFGTVLFLRN